MMIKCLSFSFSYYFVVYFILFREHVRGGKKIMTVIIRDDLF